MNWFHVTIHARPAAAHIGPAVQIGGTSRPTLVVPAAWASASLPLTFDEALLRLSNLPQVFAEPDGSFVWASAGPPGWQVDGLLHDRGDRLSHVELKGTCPADELERLVTAVGGKPRALMFQSVRDGLFLSAAAFAALAAGSA